MKVVIFLLLALLFTVFVLKKKKAQPQINNTIEPKPYAAVKIEPCDFSCPAAFEHASKPFLVSEAPSLPLAECNKIEACRCKFVHHHDRRQSSDDRRLNSQIMRDTFHGEEKRSSLKKGRRKED